MYADQQYWESRYQGGIVGYCPQKGVESNEWYVSKQGMFSNKAESSPKAALTCFTCVVQVSTVPSTAGALSSTRQQKQSSLDSR